jgi:hypothetical protein
MEIADVRKRILLTIERAKQRAVERRARGDEAARAYSTLLDTIAVPMFRQVANVLRAEGYSYSVFTPSGSVRLMSDRSAEDFIELTLDTSGGEPQVVGRTSRSRGRRVVESEGAIGSPAALSEGDLLEFLVKELEAFVER